MHQHFKTIHRLCIDSIIYTIPSSFGLFLVTRVAIFTAAVVKCSVALVRWLLVSVTWLCLATNSNNESNWKKKWKDIFKRVWIGNYPWRLLAIFFLFLHIVHPFPLILFHRILSLGFFSFIYVFDFQKEISDHWLMKRMDFKNLRNDNMILFISFFLYNIFYVA